MYNYGCDDFLEPLIQNGGTYSLAWKDDGAVLAGKTGDLTWARNNLYTDAEITLDLKGGLLLEIDYSNSESYQSMYGWWYNKNDGSWIRDSKITSVNPRKNNYAFFCPGDEGSYNFLLLPSQAISPADMTWDEAVAVSSGMPYVEDITVKNNTAVKASVKLEGSFIASAIYATVPNSTLVGPAQFSDVNESMTFTGHIELDEGVQGNMKVLRINAAGTDSGGRVATQITSVVVDGKKYPYTKIELQNQTLSGQLVSKQFQTYYQITFEDPVKLPCDITIYGKSMRTSSDCVLNVTAELDNEKYDWQPVGTVTVKAPVISVEMPDSTSSGTVLAYLSIPSGQTVDIYDGDTLVLSRVRSGDVEIPLNGTAAGRVSVHTITFKWSNNNGISSAPVSQTVIHADGVPKLTEQYLQCGSSRSNSWRNVERNHIYSYTSSNPPEFRLTCTIENSENLAGGVVFSVTRLDGTVSYMGTAQSGDTFTTEAFSGSPVIGAAALYEPDWDKINAVLQAEMPSLPDDSPSRDRTGFAETVVIPYEDHKIQFEEQPSLTDEETEELTRQIQAFQAEIEEIYRNDGGQAGFYLIDIGTGQFVPAADMINSLDTGYVPQGETGTTTMARPLTPGQLDGELGSGEWSRYTFTEPGESGGSASTGMEIYTQSVTTESGVSGTITIATDGQGNIFEFATAQGEGTGSGEGYTLPDSGTYPSGGTGSGGVGGFSFTSFGSDGMSVFTNVCDDVTFTSNTIKDITSAFTGAEATGGFGMIDRGLGIYSFGKDMADGMDKQLTLADLLNAPNGWLSSPCAQKLSPAYRQNMQRQIDQFIKDVRDAEAWNMVVTGGNYILGAGGLFGLVNPVAGIIGGTAAWGASKITSQKVDNVQKQAVLLRDMIDLQIEKTARANNDPDCMGKSSKTRRQPYNVCIDPSGIVYEAVLSNPVEGATVKLYGDGTDYKPVYTVNDDGLPVMVDDSGNPAIPSNAEDASGAALNVPKENATIPAEHELTTAANGKFQWMVQEGLWYVTAEKEGYEAGSSGNDRAAVVDAGGTKWLPVSPEQLDVNIPLISYDAPSAEVAYKPDGVYISFSKYMDDMTLTDGNFTLTSDGQPVSFTVEKLNSEQAPANINYDGDPPRYTSQIKLASPLDENAKISLTIGENVKTYAGIAWGETSALQGTVTNAADLEKPEFSQNGGTVDYGTVITITGPEGAQIYYTTDGSEPSADNGTRYYGENILMNADMTIKACAIKLGTSSDVATATFRVSPADDGSIIGDPDNQPGTEPGGNTPGGSGGGSGGEISYSVSVPASSGIQGGSITVSPRSADQGDIVTITVRPDENYELDTLTVTDAKGNKVELTRAGDNRYTFTMPGSDVKIAVSFKESAEQVTNPFTDVHESDYYYDAVLWAVANGVTNGTGATTFSPDNPVSRAQMVTFLWRAYGSPKATGSNPFTDVDESAWYYDAVLWAVANGVTNGTSATTFSPDTSVTRAQSVTFQWRAAGSPEASGSSFDDVAENAYYNDAVVWAVASGITVGTGGNNFSPDVVVSRAQAVTFLYRELA